jgi:hypothetical protein
MTEYSLGKGNGCSRCSEPFARENKDIRSKFGQVLLSVSKNAPLEQVLQMSLTAYTLDSGMSHKLLAGIVESMIRLR